MRRVGSGTRFSNLISGRGAIQRPMNEGVESLYRDRDVYLHERVTMARFRTRLPQVSVVTCRCREGYVRHPG